MRAWIRGAVLVTGWMAVACGGALGTSADDAGTNDASSLDDDGAATGADATSDTGRAKDSAATDAGANDATALDDDSAATGADATTDTGRVKDSAAADSASPGAEAGLDATVSADGSDASTATDVSAVSVEASAGDGGGVIVLGDGGLNTNQATSFLVNPAHTNAVDDPSIVPPLQLAWALASGTGTDTYPLIAGGLVYLLATVDGLTNTQLIALDEATGETRWGPVDLGASFVQNDAYDSGRLLVTDSQDGTVRAFDATNGAPLWVSNVTAYSNQPPTAYGGLLYIGGLGTVTAVDETDGATVWTKYVGGNFGTSPAVTEEALFVANGICSDTFALDRQTGATLWQYTGSCTNSGGPAPAVYGGRVWVPQSYGGGEVVLDEATGALIASYAAVSYPTFAGTMAIWNQRPPLTALDFSTARNAWTFAGDGDLAGLPVFAGGNVYMGSIEGRFFAVDQTTGLQTWQAQVASANLPGPTVVGEGLLMTVTYGQVLAYRHVDVPDASVLDPAPDGGCPSSGCLEAPVVLASESTIGLAIDANNVYWTGAGVRMVPKAGGTPTSLYSEPDAESWGIAVDANNVYWTDPNFAFSGTPMVMQGPIGGGAAIALLSGGDPGQEIVVGPSSIFFTTPSGPDAVLSVPIGGGAVTPVPGALNGSQTIAVDAMNLYFSTDVTYKLPFAGGSAVPIAPAASALASDGTTLFYAATEPGGGELIGRVPIAGGTPVVLVDGRQASIVGMAVDADNVYWTEGSGTILEGAVAALPKSGGRVALLATGLGDPSQLAVDDTGIYFPGNGQIQKIPKQH